jgi:transcriptional regulator GlxA family with amidase domain
MLRVGLVLPAGFNVLTYSTVATFETVNLVAGEELYSVCLLSELGGPVANSFGCTTNTEPLGIGHFDTLLVGSGVCCIQPSRGLVTRLQEASKKTRRIASMCLSAFVLAEAGILDGRRVTTHWAWAQELEARFPKVKVEMDRIFIEDGPVWSSAGMTAVIDMALGLVERDMGAHLARATARMMVVHHRRAGGQSQHSAMLELDAKSDRVQNALTFARQNLRETLTVERLAEAARLSPRQFTRVFRVETGQSPARAIENLRLEAARYMLEQGRLHVEEVARETGFGDGQRMRRSFLRSYGQTPQAIRNVSHPLAQV